MTFDEKTLRSVIAEVIKEMTSQPAPAASAPAAAAPAPATLPAAGKITLTEQGDAPKGVAPDEVVIGLAPAFNINQTEKIIHQPQHKVLREIIAGNEEEKIKWRGVRVYRTSDV